LKRSPTISSIELENDKSFENERWKLDKNMNGKMIEDK